jgi:hypothetical protein
MPARKTADAATPAAPTKTAARRSTPSMAKATATPAPAAKSVQGAKANKAAKSPKLRRKPVRDSFTMPEADFGLIATLKARALSAQREVKKSELLRAGLHALAALDTPTLVKALGDLEPVKVGRPRKG